MLNKDKILDLEFEFLCKINSFAVFKLSNLTLTFVFPTLKIPCFPFLKGIELVK